MSSAHRAGLRHRQAVRVLLNDVNKPGESGGSREVTVSGLREYVYLSSALYHLRQAYGCHLRFIAESCGVVDPWLIGDLQSLSVSLAARDSHSPEVEELRGLAGEGWLADLLAAYQQLSLLPSSESQPGVEPRQPGLSLVDAGDLQRALNLSNVKRWLKALENLIARHQRMLEQY